MSLYIKISLHETTQQTETIYSSCVQPGVSFQAAFNC